MFRRKTRRLKLQNYGSSKTNCETFRYVQNFCELTAAVKGRSACFAQTNRRSTQNMNILAVLRRKKLFTVGASTDGI